MSDNVFCNHCHTYENGTSPKQSICEVCEGMTAFGYSN